MKAPSQFAIPDTLVLDDSKTFLKPVVENLRARGVNAVGIDSFSSYVRAARSGDLAHIQIMFLDMRLGRERNGVERTAIDAMLFVKSYIPDAKVIIFTHKGISISECIRCLKLGALGIIPKSSQPDDIILAAQVYRYLGDTEMARENVIQELWTRLLDAPVNEKGALLEMLVINLMNSIGLAVVQNNRLGGAGEIDVVLENSIAIPFWQELKSFHILVECKNRSAPPQISDFSVLMGKIKHKGSCRAGIMVSLSGVSSGFRRIAESERGEGIVFYLGKDEIGHLVHLKREAREPFLRGTLSKQI